VSAPAPLASDSAAFRAALHAWYRAHRRELPWRTEPSLYRTVVSEFMLQQTQVATALPYFHRWMRALPDFAALAAASEDEVLKLWEGLGYYSRARNLHRLARALAALPEPPRDPASWRELPGVGPYTAAAVTSIAFGHPAACVDGNVVRILARLTGERRGFRDGTEAVRHFTPLADTLAAGPDPGTHNQAMMELGATVCFRRKPLCLTCPVAGFCAARRAGDPESLPELAPKRVEKVEVDRAFCLDRARLLLRRGAADDRRLAGLHELPRLEEIGRAAGKLELLATKRRAITRHQFTERIHRVTADARLRARVRADVGLVWVPVSALAAVTLSGPHRRWVAELVEAAAARRPSGTSPR
jgi:A/G-specific adenine glycosylase